jgi:hypothetical protein
VTLAIAACVVNAVLALVSRGGWQLWNVGVAAFFLGVIVAQ